MDDSFLAAPRHAVAVIGGACSGAEAAEILAQAGVYVVVVEQNARPFGKIEDGLPRWHARQRSQEYVRIGNKLKTPGIDYLPLTTIGGDISIEDLRGMGFSAVILACGAWNDRTLQTPDAADFEDRGLIYQNPFIYWFNHHEEASYDGPAYKVVDGSVCVGGGLASIDCIKAMMLETVAEKLRGLGHEVDVVDMEHKGIDKKLDALGLTLGDLGLEGCTLVYRRTIGEMPLAAFKPGADEESRKKTMAVREKLMSIVKRKFLCHVREGTLPKGIVADDDGNVAGIRFINTKSEGRKVIEIEGTEGVIPTTQIISSIGSVPRPISGLPMSGEFYEYDDWDMGVVKDMDGMFGVGNVVTGQGNIAISRRHAKKVTDDVVARYLGAADEQLDEEAGVMVAAESMGAAAAEAVQEHVAGKAKLAPEQLRGLREKITARQAEVGYAGDFDAWIEKVTPPDRV